MHESFLNLFLFSVLPLSAVFCIERFLIFQIKHSKRKRKLASFIWLHPNSISYMRYPMGIVSVLFYSEISQAFGIFWFGLWMITDITDGSIARHLNLTTEKGQSIDPMSDKLLYFPPIFYAVYLGYFKLEFALIFLTLDIFGQLSRFFARETAANLFGKTKTFMIVLTLMIPFFKDTYFAEESLVALGLENGFIFTISNSFLIICSVLSFCSFFFRAIPNYWYANILSLLNFLCGIGGIVLVLIGGAENLKFAFALVFLGQFLDLFDGRAAERWGSTPWGELLDDLADGTNFGGTIAFIVFFSFPNYIIGLILGLLHFVCTIYRLIRFLNDKKLAGVKTGMSVFNGLPSPGAAFFTGSAMIFLSQIELDLGFHWDWVKTGVVIIGSLLMVSHIPYIHVGRSLLPKIPKLFRVLLYTIILIGILVTFRAPSENHIFMVLFIASLLYILFGVNFSRKK